MPVVPPTREHVPYQAGSSREIDAAARLIICVVWYGTNLMLGQILLYDDVAEWQEPHNVKRQPRAERSAARRLDAVLGGVRTLLTRSPAHLLILSEVE